MTTPPDKPMSARKLAEKLADKYSIRGDYPRSQIAADLEQWAAAIRAEAAAAERERLLAELREPTAAVIDAGAMYFSGYKDSIGQFRRQWDQIIAAFTRAAS